METRTGSSSPSSSAPDRSVDPSNQEDDIDLLALAASLWVRKWQIVGVTLVFAAAGAAYAFLATPVYRAEAVLAPNKAEQGPSLPAGLGGLAGLAGISLNSGTADQTEALATLQSRVFAESFINDKNLLPVLFAKDWDAAKGGWTAGDPDDWPNIEDGITFFTDEVLSVDTDSTTGLITLGIEWSDAVLAAEWAEELVQRINERMRARDLADSEAKLAYLNEELKSASLVELRQAISRLIENEIQTSMLARAETEYAFKVIDPPRMPNEPVAPKKILILALATFLGVVVGVLVALLRTAARRSPQTDRG